VTTSLATVASAAPAAQATRTATPTATSAAACVSPPQGTVVIVGFPNPGDALAPGSNVVVQGVAYDTASTSGPGIDRVSVYLGDRDAGGLFWGNATLGLPNPQTNTGPLASAGFSLRSPAVPAGTGARTINVYARSSLTNREAIASVPVFIGVAPTPVRGQVPTAVLPPPPACTPTPTPTVTPLATSTPALVAATPTSTPLPGPPTPTPIPAALLPPLPAPPAAAAPPPAFPAAPPAAVAPATATTAPRAGGIPAIAGLLVVVAGAGVVGAGVVARRRERRGADPRS
jgi:hypothetical protein